MISHKYTKDYKLDESGNGTVYVGKFYEVEETEEERKKRITVFLVCAFIAWVVFIGSMCFYSDLSKTIIVAVPYAINAILFVYMTEGISRYVFSKGPLKRQEKERMVDRIKAHSIVGILVTTISFASCIVSFAVKLVKPEPKNFIFFGCEMVVIILDWIIHITAQKIKVVETN